MTEPTPRPLLFALVFVGIGVGVVGLFGCPVSRDCVAGFGDGWGRGRVGAKKNNADEEHEADADYQAKLRVIGHDRRILKSPARCCRTRQRRDGSRQARQ